MITQYAIAGTRAGVVIGTEHAAESPMGFFTKFGAARTFFRSPD